MFSINATDDISANEVIYFTFRTLKCKNYRDPNINFGEVGGSEFISAVSNNADGPYHLLEL